MSLVMDDQIANNAAELIKMCLADPKLSSAVFEKLYVGMSVTRSMCIGNGTIDLKDMRMMADQLESLYITEQTPLILERDIAIDRFLNGDAPIVSKQEACIFKGFNMPLTLISDNVVIVHEHGKEPAILIIKRDPKAPDGVAECAPGGWVGPADFDANSHTLNTAQLKLDNEITIVTPHRHFQPSRFMGYKNYSEEVTIDGLSRDVAIQVDGIDDPLVARGVIPFFHKAAHPDFQGDDNMLNLLRVVRLKVPAGTEFKDATGYGREVYTVPVSDFAQDRGIPMLPTLPFIRDKIVPALKL